MSDPKVWARVLEILAKQFSLKRLDVFFKLLVFGLLRFFLKSFSVVGTLCPRHRDLIAKNPVYNGINIANNEPTSLHTTFPTW